MWMGPVPRVSAGAYSLCVNRTGMRGKCFFAISFSGRRLKSLTGRLTTTVIMDLFPFRETTGCWTGGGGVCVCV